MDSNYVSLWYEVKASRFIEKHQKLHSDWEELAHYIYTSLDFERDLILFLETDGGLTETFARELHFRNVFESIKVEIRRRFK